MATSTFDVRAGFDEPPRARAFPVVGSLPVLLRDPFAFLRDQQARCGDVYQLELGLTKLVVLTHPRHAQHVLLDNAANYPKLGRFWDTLRRVLGNGLVVSDGDFWLRQRRMMQPHFHRERLSTLTSLMVEAIGDSLERWGGLDAEQPANLVLLFSELTMKVTSSALFGTRVPREDMIELSNAMVHVVDHALSAMIWSALPRWLPVPARRRYEAASAVVDRTVVDIIARARRNRRSSSNLLSMLLEAVDDRDGTTMTDKQLRDEVTTLFLAGYETTSLALTWVFELLSDHPEVEQRLHAEVDTVLSGRTPSFDDLAKLPYARMVLQEALRIRPPAWQLPRVAVRDDVIGGYRIPAGTNVVVLIYGCHHHPSEWPQPERFDPDRFAPERAAARHKLAYMPFGAGKRQCIGRDFSLLEGQLALAMVAQRYEVRRASRRTHAPYLSSTLRPKSGLPVRLYRRSRAAAAPAA